VLFRSTSALVIERLKELGITVHSGIGGTGVVGVLTRGEGPMIGLRADMDALPILEATDKPYRSQNSGLMHACGHDGHTAMLLGAAAQLARSGGFRGTVVFVFQPAEENDAGAKAMIADGLFERFPVAALYGMHNFPGMPAGHFGTCAGPMLASFDKFEIEVRGTGGHSSQPHLGTDALRAGMAIGLALPDMPRHLVNPLSAAVMSVTQLESGASFNVIPDLCRIKGSFRTLDPAAHAALAGAFHAEVERVAASHGCETTIHLDLAKSYPVLANTPRETGAAVAAALAVAGAEKVTGTLTPMLAGEDFAFYLKHVPGNFMGLGNGEASAPLHTALYDFNDDALAAGIAYWTSLVRTELPDA
jgi:amidohydrolase